MIADTATQVRAAARRSRKPRASGESASLERLQHLAEARVAIERVSPEIDGGRFPAKAVVGQNLRIEADIFCDGHDRIGAAVLYRHAGERDWREASMAIVDNDRWAAHFTVERQAPLEFTIHAWRDLFASWAAEVSKKAGAGQDVTVELSEVRPLLVSAIEGERGDDEHRAQLQEILRQFDADADVNARLALLLGGAVTRLYRLAGPRTNLTVYDKVLRVWVDRPAAAFSAWYELMPRSQSGDAGRHGTFDDVIARLPYVRDLGFDVLYMPPIHPIGHTNRKGRNNAVKAEPDDHGSPYAIGSEEGGHDAIHPELGDFASFARLVKAAREHGLEVALDFAIQCSPDHPWIKEHKEWFDWRPDGSIRFAENPPKKYEDIVNVHFYRDALPSLWLALRDIVLFWAEKGVRIFRVDNPHTKPLPFWEWMIGEVQARYPDTIFLAEAFTRPKMMKRLAKLGFTQSYSYFTWRNTKQELRDYLSELTRGEERHYFRPNFFANTPDINPFYLQWSGRPGFQVRLVLAALLSGNYGIYSGFELCEAAAVPGKEEYLDSEKYEIRAWDWDRPGNIREDVALVNRLRNEHAALKDFTNVEFYNAWNDNILYFGRRTPDLQSFILVAVNLDPHHPQGADFEVPLWEFGRADHEQIAVEDLVTGARFDWHGKIQHIDLDPAVRPYAIWRLDGEGATS
ncbi:alpha-1,4-glucan--maltose-1-phosphate maltosyltransferase [Breoghania sp. JC706]|uniref:alpha-1,4-glucan--maltose-1-phosphate maltosyltransferase n=1 Tax=Breoghania sp. JC706 TaxID=3117732 RepID=UPI00300A6538